MVVLGVDTALSFCEVSLFIDGNIYFKKYSEEKSSEKLLFWIKDLFDEHKISPNCLDKLVVSIGPGSFTGIRVGVVAVRTMAQVLNIPVMGVNYLELLEYIFFENFYKDKKIKLNFVVTLMNALRGEFYTKIYDVVNQKNLVINQIFNKDDIMKKMEELNCNDSNINIGIVKNYDIGNVSFNFDKINFDIFDVSMDILQSKSYILEFALKKDNFLEYKNIKPLYIRKSFAEERKEKENLKDI